MFYQILNVTAWIQACTMVIQNSNDMAIRIEFLSDVTDNDNNKTDVASCTFAISSRIDSINENNEYFVYSASVATQTIATLCSNDNNSVLNIIFDSREGASTTATITTNN